MELILTGTFMLLLLVYILYHDGPRAHRDPPFTVPLMCIVAVALILAGLWRVH